MSGKKQMSAPKLGKPESSTPGKKNTKIGLTGEKYLNAKLIYSEKKKMNIQRFLDTKDQRINELEGQIKDNQNLVRETLQKWNQYRTKADRQNAEEMHQVQLKVKQLTKTFTNTERTLVDRSKHHKKLQQQNQILRQSNRILVQKSQKMEQKYREDKKQWKYICNYLSVLIEGIQKMPPHILKQYFP